MVKKMKRGASRIPVRKERKPLVWQHLVRHFVVVMAVLFFSIGGIYLYQDDTLPILHVTVDGDFEHVDKATFVETVSPHARGGFMTVDVAGIREAGESLPWVKQIQIRRVWPDSLHFIVEEHTAVAQWGENGLVSENGELFFPDVDTIPENLAVLIGPEQNYRLMLKQFQTMSKALISEKLVMKTLVMDQRRSWAMTLNNGLQVQLGRTSNKQRFDRFINVYTKKLHAYQSAIASMDMRYTNGLAVQWKQNQKPDFNGTV